jgi:hypothetical protein
MKKKALLIATPVIMLVAGFTYAFTSGGSNDIENCPLKGTADCPIVKNCPEKGTADCPYTAEATTAGEEIPECCKKK